ncbi:MAG: hypothetical protein US51_C0040G0005 [Microgenomates group bacterium GW2011_GWA2_37_6]|nr:MAG: hypothetical protein US51_C0040G0005 [Microgenomates group bacterium GW2011_GWA2_37_6]
MTRSTLLRAIVSEIESMKKPILLLGILFLTIVILFGVRAAVSNRLSTSGVALGRLQDEFAKYRTQNIQLKEKIYSLSSLSHVSSEAAKLGFVESKANFALTRSYPIALKQ